jgi:hypothetical protein
MITYTKTIISMQAYKEIDGESNVVFGVSWSLVGTENGFTATCPATTYVPYTAGQPFIPYADLTQEQVLAWIDQYTPLAQMQSFQNAVSFSLQQQQQQETPALPWDPPPVPPVTPTPPTS